MRRSAADHSQSGRRGRVLIGRVGLAQRVLQFGIAQFPVANIPPLYSPFRTPVRSRRCRCGGSTHPQTTETRVAVWPKDEKKLLQTSGAGRRHASHSVSVIGTPSGGNALSMTDARSGACQQPPQNLCPPALDQLF